MSDRTDYKAELSYEFVSSKLTYEPDTGKFFWLEDVSKNIKAGYEAGCVKATRVSNKTGKPVSYRYIRVGREIPAVQLAWLLGHGEWAAGRIGFKNGDSLDLRLDNLEMQNSLSSSSVYSGSEGRKQYMKDSRQAFPMLWKDRHLQTNFGLSLAEYGEMILAQDGKCAICNRPEMQMRNGKRKSLAVDHDHATGKIRGLLCSDCNTGIGKLQDDRDVLLAAVRYLDSHSEDAKNVVPLSPRKDS